MPLLAQTHPSGAASASGIVQLQLWAECRLSSGSYGQIRSSRSGFGLKPSSCLSSQFGRTADPECKAVVAQSQGPVPAQSRLVVPSSSHLGTYLVHRYDRVARGRNDKGPETQCFRAFVLVAGAGFEPATFGL